MGSTKDIAQFIHRIKLSIARPLPSMEYLEAKTKDRLGKDCDTYRELDNRFFDYQRLDGGSKFPITVADDTSLSDLSIKVIGQLTNGGEDTRDLQISVIRN